MSGLGWPLESIVFWKETNIVRIINELGEMQQAQRMLGTCSMAILTTRGSTCSVSGFAAESASDYLTAPIHLK
jgi:hypothetical protein